MATLTLNDRYQIEETLGRGGEGRVFAAIDSMTGARVAVKLIDEPDASRAARLRAEFSRLSTLRHRNLLAVLDIDAAQTELALETPIARGSLFFTAELIDGPDLAAWAEADAAPLALLDRLEECADALATVHRAGTIHCDVKPSNVIVSDERGAVLLDFGLSLCRGVRGEARGTLAYMDERALAGAPDAQSDLHALGVTFYRAAAMIAPYPHRLPSELATALAEGNPTRLGELRADLPRALADLIDALIRPRECPRSAASLLRRIWDARTALGASEKRRSLRESAGAPVRLVGRDAVVEQCSRAIKVEPGSRTAPLIALVAEGGLGASAVIEEATRRAQIACVSAGSSLEVLRGDAGRILEMLCEGERERLSDLEGRARRVASADAALRGLAARANLRPVVWVLDRSGGSGELALEVAHALVAGHRGLDGVPATIIARLEEASLEQEPELDDRVVVARLEPLTAADVAELASAILGEAPSASWLKTLAAGCLGRPSLLVRCLLAAAQRSEPLETLDPRQLVGDEEGARIEEHLRDLAGELDDADVAVASAVAVVGAAVAPSFVAALTEKSEDEIARRVGGLLASGWLEMIEEGVAITTPARARALERTLGAHERKAVHRAVLDRLEAAGLCTPAERARHLAIIGPMRTALAAMRAAAAYHLERGELVAAATLAEECAAKSEGSELSSAVMLLATIRFELGDYGAAQAHAERAARSRNSNRRRRGLLLAARARQRSGDLTGAARDLVALRKLVPDDLAATGALAKIYLLRGQYDEAATCLGPTGPLLATDLDAAGDGLELCLEAAGLAELYRGDRTLAVQAFDKIGELAEKRSDAALAGRAHALLGLAAHHEGDVARAAEHYRDAASAAARSGQIHAAASAEINRATAEADRGRFVSALAALDAALVSLRRLGNVGELAAALYNRAHCLFALGDIAAAEATARRALSVAKETGRAQFEIYAELLLGDVARRDGDAASAAGHYQAAAEVAASGGASLDTTSIELNLAELCAERGESAAFEHLERAEAAGSGDRERLILVRARCALLLGAEVPGLLAEIEPAIERARARGREDLYWRLAALAARLAAAAGTRDRARAHAAASRAEIERTLSAIASDRHPAMRRDPDAVALAALEAELELSSLRAPLAPDPSGDVSASLRRLLSLSSRLNSELRTGPLLDQVIDTAIELAGAERGFLLLTNLDSGEQRLEVAVARNIDQRSLESEGDTAVSRSIAERAARSGEVVLALDAAFDERWGAAESVAAMRLRSVLAVPLRFRRELLGTIYVDHRFRAGAFGERAVRLVRELANIAGVAIGNARITEESQARAAEITALNRQLEEELGQRESELATVRCRIPAGDVPEASEIVGSSPAIRELHGLVERMAKASLPVVISGESGSGKELVARALHRLSPRRSGPFVAVNCGAVAETLLESELFGHVRGAFTGADRNRRGHFEVADGGTLFLDEIADTSPAMQAKLLRVLQEGELRRLGDEEVRRIDVRVACATNRDLRELVAAGAFREDLFFRLNVLAIRVPPLRERASDIGEIAEHLLIRLARGGTPVAIARDALAALCRYDWPGNVRELENELARSAALGEGVITRAHLSPHIVPTAAPTFGATGGDGDLDLKQRVEGLERELIEAALARSGGNQTQAAKILGLSRYGLQKKLKRYA